MADDRRKELFEQLLRTLDPWDLTIRLWKFLEGEWKEVFADRCDVHGITDFDSLLNFIYTQHLHSPARESFRWEMYLESPCDPPKLLGTGIIDVGLGSDRSATRGSRGDTVTWAYTKLLASSIRAIYTSDDRALRPNDAAAEASDLALSALRAWDEDLHKPVWLKDDWCVGSDGNLAEPPEEPVDSKITMASPSPQWRLDPQSVVGAWYGGIPGANLPLSVPIADAPNDLVSGMVDRGNTPSPIFVSQAHIGRPYWTDDYISADTETTGLDEDARILSVSVVHFRQGQIIERWQCLTDPGDKIDWDSPSVKEALAVNGHTRAEIAMALGTKFVLRHMFQLMRRHRVWVGHNIGFDLRMLQRHADLYGMAMPERGMVLDTKAMYVHVFGLGDIHRLTHCCKQLGVPLTDEEAHTALGDSEASGRLLLAIVDAARAKGTPLSNNFDEIEAAQAEAEVIWRAAHPNYR